MLEAEESRQHRLKQQLASGDSGLGDDGLIFNAYKQLQFFDTLSLYFHMTPQGERGTAEFHNVPRAVGDDVIVSVVERGGAVYEVDPYPFAADGLELVTEGRYLAPQPPGADLGEELAATPVDTQTVLLVRA